MSSASACSSLQVIQCSGNTRTAAGSQEGSGLAGGGVTCKQNTASASLLCALLIQMLVYTVDAHALKVCLEHRAMETCAMPVLTHAQEQRGTTCPEAPPTSRASCVSVDRRDRGVKRTAQEFVSTHTGRRAQVRAELL